MTHDGDIEKALQGRGPGIERVGCDHRCFQGLFMAPLLFHFGAERIILEADPEKAEDGSRSVLL